jgi:hypothetical protein
MCGHWWLDGFNRLRHEWTADSDITAWIALMAS